METARPFPVTRPWPNASRRRISMKRIWNVKIFETRLECGTHGPRKRSTVSRSKGRRFTASLVKKRTLGLAPGAFQRDKMKFRARDSNGELDRVKYSRKINFKLDTPRTFNEFSVDVSGKRRSRGKCSLFIIYQKLERLCSVFFIDFSSFRGTSVVLFETKTLLLIEDCLG